MMHKFLIHNRGDHVGVATSDIEAHESVTGIFMEDDSSLELVARSAIPLGHKIALVERAPGDDVVEYGQVIGRATIRWEIGDYVHTHNIRSKRWS